MVIVTRTIYSPSRGRMKQRSGAALTPFGQRCELHRDCRVVRTSLSGLLWWKHTISISKWLDITTDLVMTSSQAVDIHFHNLHLTQFVTITSGKLQRWTCDDCSVIMQESYSLRSWNLNL